jgi:hypothetical protein
MAAEYQNISAEDMESFLVHIGFQQANPGHPCKETVYEAPYGNGFRIRVYSTIGEEWSRKAGGDAIRVICVNEQGHGFHSTTRVHRTQNWRRNLLNRIDSIHKDVPKPTECTCGNGILLPKKGRNGVFLGCSDYPNCRNTQNVGVAQ